MMLLDIHEPGQTPMPHEGGASVGIDLGTTHSLVAISSDGLHEVVTDEQGNALMPSVVSYDANKPIRSIKRLMGKGRDDVDASYLPYELADGDTLALDVNGKAITPVEISAEILKKLKALAETSLDNEVKQAVITVPAYFDDAARTATKDAAKLAGLDVLRLVNEPTAAALAYGLDSSAEGVYAIYDLGGGTFDVSLLKMEKGVFQVLATGGDTLLGGDDIDHAIAQHFTDDFLVGLTLSKDEQRDLLQVAKAAKEALSADEDGVWEVTAAGKEMQVALDRQTLNHLIHPLIERTIATFEQVLEDSGKATGEVKEVVMVGGSTRIPYVQERVAQLIGKQPLTSVDPDKVVAIGAAIQAEALTQGSSNLLLDVTPLSLGLETMGGIVDVIIPRNTAIPTSQTQKFTTYEDGQSGMKIHVVQGEREMVADCRSLAHFELKGIPPMQAGAAVIAVTFTLDADGLLTVSAKEETTGAEQRIEVKPSYGLPPEEVEKMLYASMEHAQEDITARLLIESRVEAQQAVIATQKAMEQDAELLKQEEETRINQQIGLINQLIDGKDRDGIDLAVQDLEHMCAPFVERRVNKAIGAMLKGKSVEDLKETA